LNKILLTCAFLSFVLAASLAGPASGARFDGCNVKPASSLVVNVKDRGAKGDGKSDDTKSIQQAIDEVAGSGGTVYVPDGNYIVQAHGKKHLVLGSKMTLKLTGRPIRKVIPTAAKYYSVLRIPRAKDVTVIGGTL
jgi:polygalacturonase